MTFAAVSSLHASPLSTHRVLLPLVAFADAVILGWVLLVYGWTEDAMLLFTRYSARISFLVFLPIFICSAMMVLFPSAFWAQFVKRRRQWGLSFAFAHTLHMFGIMAHYRMRGEWFTAEDIPALVIYALIYLMAVTSNNWSARTFGPVWKLLHKVGIYGIYVAFSSTYVGRFNAHQVNLESNAVAHEWYLVYLVLAIAVNVGLLLRIAAFWKRRFKSVTTPAQPA